MKTILIVSLFCFVQAELQAQVWLRVSVNHILNPDGALPAGGNWSSRADVDAAIAEANTYLELAGVGCQLELSAYSVRNSVLINGTTPAWNLPVSPENVHLIERYARTNNYGWRSDAANVYISHAGGPFSGYCSFPQDGDSTILLSAYAGQPRGQLLLHELGHFYGLFHSFDCNPDRCCSLSCVPQFTATGPTATGCWDDLLPDHICNWPDAISTNRFDVGRTPSTLSASEFALFSVTYSNLMSYHPQTFLLSDFQKDTIVIMANTLRANTASGRFRLVSNTGFLWGHGATTPSITSLTQGVGGANPYDVVMMHTGVYYEPQTISKPMRIIARRGPVTIR